MSMLRISSPTREYILIALLTLGLIAHYVFHAPTNIVLVFAILGAIVPFWEAILSIKRRTITIETFNAFALAVSFATTEYASAAFIGLMLAFASLLDWYTESRASNAVEELLKLKPSRAFCEVDGEVREMDSKEVKVGDIVIVKSGERVPVDGTIIFGNTYVNESSLTGESAPIEKKVGDSVYSSTLSLSGVIKIKATQVGADSTIERMARLIEQAANNKSRVERIADRFAGYFLPAVIIIGVLTYVITRDIRMTAAFFLVVCADDIAVSIPLAVTASLGRAAKRGVIIKGGEWVNVLAQVRTIAFDKTGTLTYGKFELVDAKFTSTQSESEIWKMIGSAEKFSEHPTGKAIVAEARTRVDDLVDPSTVDVLRGVGIRAHVDGITVSIGNDKMHGTGGIVVTDEIRKIREERQQSLAATVMLVFFDTEYVGYIAVADKLRPEAKQAISALIDLGIRPVMLTGDNQVVAEVIAKELGIKEFRAKLSPEDKLMAIEEIGKSSKLAMIGDGINDAPALARADVGIAMGEGGTAVAVEAANAVILTDDLMRVPEMIALSRKTDHVIKGDMLIWVVTNIFGVFLVFTGFAGPAIAALYNFLTDFLPLFNSARLFRSKYATPTSST